MIYCLNMHKKFKHKNIQPHFHFCTCKHLSAHYHLHANPHNTEVALVMLWIWVNDLHHVISITISCYCSFLSSFPPNICGQVVTAKILWQAFLCSMFDSGTKRNSCCVHPCQKLSLLSAERPLKITTPSVLTLQCEYRVFKCKQGALCVESDGNPTTSAGKNNVEDTRLERVVVRHWNNTTETQCVSSLNCWNWTYWSHFVSTVKFGRCSLLELESSESSKHLDKNKQMLK